ncbi:MAG: ABC transporter substrate-binding protein [Crocinitomicaceae bacterium]|nr:ABC transporter substrate-binding protein [Crocinitomicaceae bacterium]
MEFRKIIPLISLLMFSCIQHGQEQENSSIQESSTYQLQIKYAKGFEFEYTNDYTKVLSRSIQGNSFFEDSLFILHSEDHDLEQNCKILPTKINSICCQSSTHLAFLDFLNELDKVTGLCGTKYIESSPIHNKLKDLHEICLGEAVQSEEILSLAPDLYFIYPFASEEESKLRDQGIRTFMIAEYLEEHPIARLEWIKLFGVLTHKEKEADDYFNKVEGEYYDRVQQPDTNMKFFLNLPYGDSWYTPSANSLVVKLLEDAGLSYYYQKETGTENTPHTQEEMWETGTQANYWVIIAERPADFTLDDLIEENEVYKDFRSVIQHQVIFCNSATSDYFVTGVLEPHEMLKDILFATHKLSEHKPKYFHLLN